MARCSHDECDGWRPDVLVNRGRAGYRLDGEWYCSRQCLVQATRERLDAGSPSAWPTRGPKLGALLVSQRAVTSAALNLALREQAMTHLPLGRQLEEMGLVSAGDVLRALSTQAGVGYLTTIDPAQLQPVSGPLSAATLLELDLVPIEARHDERRLRVACVAPVPWPALHAIYEVTGWTAEPLLVSDQNWATLTEALAADDQAQAIPVENVEDAVALTADLARNRDTRDLSIARVDPYILVHVEGRHRDEDVLFHMTPKQEELCLAAST